MWIMSEDGFISAVHKDGKLQLRARDRQSLERLGFKGRRIRVGEGTDYPFRAYTTPEELKKIVNRQIDAITYPNFKSRIVVTRGRRFEAALHNVWSAMLAVEPKNVTQLLNESSWRLPRRRSARTSAESDWWTDYIDRLDRDTPEPEPEPELESDDQNLTDWTAERAAVALEDELPDSMMTWTEEQWNEWMSQNPTGV